MKGSGKEGFTVCSVIPTTLDVSPHLSVYVGALAGVTGEKSREHLFSTLFEVDRNLDVNVQELEGYPSGGLEKMI